MSLRKCKAVGCTTGVDEKRLMCLYHWRMVPMDVQTLIWKHYRPGQHADKEGPSIDYVAAAFVAVSCVSLKTGKDLPTLERRDNVQTIPTRPERTISWR